MSSINLIGRRFGRLVVEAEAPRVGGRLMWLCMCDCGRKEMEAGPKDDMRTIKTVDDLLWLIEVTA